MSRPRYLSTADTAKLIRKALRRSFPGQQFYVRSRTYSMGASIDVSWMDGPTEKEVRSITQAYASAGFDGMIDLQFHYNAWLLPDGSAVLASSSGTAGSGGTVEPFQTDQPHPQAERVSFGADYVHTKRVVSRDRVEAFAAEFNGKTGWAIPEIEELDWYVGRKVRGQYAFFGRDFGQPTSNGYETIGDRYNRELWQTSFYAPPAEPTVSEQSTLAEGGEVPGYQVTYDRDWTWIAFSAKPDEAVRTSLKALGGRFSRRRVAWYIRQRVDCSVINATISGNGHRSQPSGEDWFLDAHL